MQKLLWILFAAIIGVFNAVGITAALLVIAPAISEAGAIAWTIGGFVVGFLLLKGKHKTMLESIFEFVCLLLGVICLAIVSVIGKVF